MNRRTFFIKMAFILLVSQLLLVIFAPGQAFAAIFDGFDARYIVEGGRLKIILLEEDAPTPRTRVAEWVRSGTTDNGKTTTFRAGEIKREFRQDFSVNGDGTTFVGINVKTDTPETGSWKENTDISGSIEQPNVFKGFGKCTAQAETFSSSDQFDSCVKTYTEDNPDEPGGSDGGGTGDATEEEPTCEGGIFGWAICPLLDYVVDGIGFAKEAIEETLEYTIPDQSTKDGKDLKATWETMRTIANVLFVIAFLVIIISQTLVGKL